MTIVPPGSAERTGYPTQKPVRLLERIVAASSRPGDLVLDPYAGQRDDRRRRGAPRAGAGCSWTATRSPSRSPAAGSRREADRRRDDARARSPSTSATRSSRCRTAALRDGRRARRPRRSPRGSGRSTRTRSTRVWAEERARQFREEVPQFREVDLAQRLVRVLARLRGHAGAARRRALGRRGRRAAAATPAEVALGRRRLLAGVRRTPAAGAGGRVRCSSASPRATGLAILLELAARGDHRPLRRGRRLGAVPARGRRVAAGRDDQAAPGDLRARRAAALGRPAPDAILHVGDDWAADVVGAKAAGWRAAYLRRPAGRLAAPRRASRDDTVVAGPAARPARRTWRRPSIASAERQLGCRSRRSRGAVGRLAARWRRGTGSTNLGAARPRRWSRGSSSAIVVTTRDPRVDPTAGLLGALADRARRRPDRHPAVLARGVRAATAGSPTGATGSGPIRRGAWVGGRRRRASSSSASRARSSCRSRCSSLAIVVVAEATLSAER